MTSEEEIKKCGECKHYRYVGGGCGGICTLGYHTVEEVEGGPPLAYTFRGRPACEHAIFDSSTEERLVKLEKRLGSLEQTEQVELPKMTKPEFLLGMFKVIADTYAAGEVNEAIQLLRDEIAKAAGHYHNVPKEDVYWKTGDGSL